MTDHDVKLHYFSTGHPAPHDAGFAPTSGALAVRAGQTIKFSPAEGTPAGTILIRFRDKHFFSSPNPHFAEHGEYRPGDPDVVVSSALPPGIVTGYHCALLDSNGVPRAQSQENPGQPIIPGGEIILAVP
jgi:hypothetical protein